MPLTINYLKINHKEYKDEKIKNIIKICKAYRFC